MRWLILGLMLACVGVAQADEPTVADVSALRERLRGGIEGSAATPLLDASSAGALIAIFEDEAEVRHVRLRALWALTQLRGAPTSGFFARMLARSAEPGSPADALDPRRSTLVLRRAVEGVILAAPDDHSVALVAPFLAHRDARIREAAAKGLVRVGSDKARELARNRRVHEANKSVRAQLDLLLLGPHDAARPIAAPDN